VATSCVLLVSVRCSRASFAVSIDLLMTSDGAGPLTNLEKIVGPEGRCFVCSTACHDADFIPLASGGTGFAGHGDNLIATVVTPTARI